MIKFKLLSAVAIIAMSGTAAFAESGADGIPYGEYRALMEKCKSDPEGCQQKRAELRAKMEERCKADPEACAQKREEAEKKRADRKAQAVERCREDIEKCAMLAEKSGRHSRANSSADGTK